MRRLMLLATALTTLVFSAESPANAAPACTQPADQSAYEILALRQMMTVLVTKCTGREKDYNDLFIRRFGPALQGNDRTVLSYFRRVYGGAGQGRMDTFTTDLVNIMSHQANTEKHEFCSRASLLVNEMSQLRSGEELAAYAAVKDLAPHGISMCPTPTVRRR